jgi:hypothetical protein
MFKILPPWRNSGEKKLTFSPSQIVVQRWHTCSESPIGWVLLRVGSLSAQSKEIRSSRRGYQFLTQSLEEKRLQTIGSCSKARIRDYRMEKAMNNAPEPTLMPTLQWPPGAHLRCSELPCPTLNLAESVWSWGSQKVSCLLFLNRCAWSTWLTS